MRSLSFVIALLFVSVLNAQEVLVDLTANSRNFDSYIPDWGSLESRDHHEGRELQLRGGTTIVPKDEVPGNFEFRWFPEVHEEDSLIVVVATTGENANEDGSFDPKDGITFEVNTEGRVCGTTSPQGEAITTIIAAPGTSPKIEKGVSYTVRVERLELEGILQYNLFVDDNHIALLNGEKGKFPGKRIAIGNRKISYSAAGHKIISTSYIRRLKMLPE